MSALADPVLATRRSPGLFDLGTGTGTDAGSGEAEREFARGLIEVTGRDAPRWLDGMVTNDITAIASDGPANGCYAALLTPKGRIVADLHVLARPDGYWLETAAFAVGDAIERLGRYIVADDVTLADRSSAFVRLALEGPGATDLLVGVCGASLEDVAPAGWVDARIAGVGVTLARFGWSGEQAWQLFVPGDARDEVYSALRDAGAEPRETDVLEVLRVEAGVPRLGPELDEEVFPDEARLETAVSRTKGCYTGQEIVARLYSRGAVNHLLVGLRFEGDRVPLRDATLHAGDRATGEVTSACASPTAGVIGLGYVRREHAEPGTTLRCTAEDVGADGVGDAEGVNVTVAELPLVPAASAP